jgi:(2Fe-2S) ferredoxin
MTDNPTPRRKRIVVCRGVYCNAGRRADKLYQRLEQLVDEINGDQYPKPVKLETANCLTLCGMGPNLAIYPDGIPCMGVEVAMLDDIVDQYVREKKE